MNFVANYRTSLFLFLCFLLLAVASVYGFFTDWDEWTLNFAFTTRGPELTKVFVALTYLGNWQFILASSLFLTGCFLYFKDRPKAHLLIGAVFSSSIIYSLFKIIFHRVRPDVAFALVEGNGYSLPSGHAAMAVVFYGIVCYFLIKTFRKVWQKVLIIALTLTIIILISFSRIYLGVHWISDVLASWLIGSAILSFFINLFSSFNIDLKSRQQ